MLYLVYAIHVIICLFLILVVLLQQGKGADLSVFGGGSTQAAFGARGAATLLHKLTVAGFIGFIFTTMSIGFLQAGSRGSVMEAVESAPTTSVEVEAPETQAPAPEAVEPAPAEAAAGEPDSAQAPATEEPQGDQPPSAAEQPGGSS